MSDPLFDHLTRHIGPVTTVFEEIVPGDPRLDIVHISSSLFRRYEVIATRGMSARAMAVPPDSSEPRFAELLALLPKGWPVRASAFGAENNYWPIRLLKTLAQLPSEGATWIGFGHTHANGSSEATVKPYAQNTGLCAVVLLPPSDAR
jgi:Suppressor of fused protein (SUFU)